MDTTTDTLTDTLRQLPATIRAFLAAQEARDPDTALPLLAAGAVITDIGESFEGERSLRWFVAEAGAEFTYTVEHTHVRHEDGVWVVGHHLDGDFPGGTADLDYRFTLVDERIARLDIVLG